MAEHHSFNNIFNADDVNIQVNVYNENFIKCLDQCAPIVTRKITRPISPWFSDELREAIIKRNAIHNKLETDRTNVLLMEQQYRHEKKQVKLFIQSTKNEYYKNKLTNTRSNSSDTWNVIREIIPNHKNCSRGYILDDMKRKAEEFNYFFANVGKNTFELTQESLRNDGLAYPQLSSAVSGNRNIYFRPQPVNVETVILTIKNLKETQSVGCDGS